MTDSFYKLDDFELYQKACEFRRKVYSVIKQLPPEERFALAVQMRKAAVSVTNNIAEGHGRWHYQENIQFCRISRGSVEELIDDFNICIDEHYCPDIDFPKLKKEAYNLIKNINGYISYLKKCKQGKEE